MARSCCLSAPRSMTEHPNSLGHPFIQNTSTHQYIPIKTNSQICTSKYTYEEPGCIGALTVRLKKSTHNYRTSTFAILKTTRAVIMSPSVLHTLLASLRILSTKQLLSDNSAPVLRIIKRLLTSSTCLSQNTWQVPRHSYNDTSTYPIKS